MSHDLLLVHTTPLVPLHWPLLSLTCSTMPAEQMGVPVIHCHGQFDFPLRAGSLQCLAAVDILSRHKSVFAAIPSPQLFFCRVVD